MKTITIPVILQYSNDEFSKTPDEIVSQINNLIKFCGTSKPKIFLDVVEYNGVSYPVREVEIDGQVLKVSTEALNAAIMTNEGEYVDEAARRIDEALYAFISDEDIIQPYKKLQKLVKDRID